MRTDGRAAVSSVTLSPAPASPLRLRPPQHFLMPRGDPPGRRATRPILNGTEGHGSALSRFKQHVGQPTDTVNVAQWDQAGRTHRLHQDSRPASHMLQAPALELPDVEACSVPGTVGV